MAVSVTETYLTLDTYAEPPHEELPMFAENRVHQRSSGNPYPNPVVLSVCRDQRAPKDYLCVRLENEYLRLEILPELGGRIYSAYDKTTGYDFFYKQHVIKPALIGLLGSWVSGGVEFNWPCHHRPSTFMPVDYFIEKDDEGAATLWMSEHEPLDRMKGMVGVRLAPGEARFDTRMKVFNRTPVPHSFLWWENAAVPVNKQYRLFFPPDVHYAQFHYRKNVTSYPIAKGIYNGIRMDTEIDISQHKNTLHPTSYFSAASHYDFFGGYDEKRGAGVVHIGDHNVAVGKKMFTWAYHQLADAWEAALTDDDGMYAELMAGSYSNNQPDFTWLQPYEEKDFVQSWYPIGAIGAPICATLDAAISKSGGRLALHVTKAFKNAKLILNGQAYTLTLDPANPCTFSCDELSAPLQLRDQEGRPLLIYAPKEERPDPTPCTILDNPSLDALPDAQACYLAGIHVAQYRDPAILPDAYWREALKRDPDHAPSHQALSRFLYERGFFQEALLHARKAWTLETAFNFHPQSGETPYLLGLISEALSKDQEAADWYQKSAWAQDSRAKSMTRAAMIDGRQKNPYAMEKHALQAIKAHPGNGTAWACLAAALKERGAVKECVRALRFRLSNDPLDLLSIALLRACGEKYDYHALTDAYQNALDIGYDLKAMGETSLADQFLKGTARPKLTAFPFRAEEIDQLGKSGSDPYGLACALYNKGHYTEAAALLRPMTHDYRALRNLAVADYSHLGRREEALTLLDRALALAPEKQQLIYEKAYLMGRLNRPANERIDFLSLHSSSSSREDILIEYARALNQAGQYQRALDVLLSRSFTPCEGGEHAVAEQYMFACHAMGRASLKAESSASALSYFRAAQTLPSSLGAGLWHEALLVPHRYYEAECLRLMGDDLGANAIYSDITALYIDYFSNMHLPELRCWQALCWNRLGHGGRGEMMLREHIRQYQSGYAARDPGFFKTTPFFISYMEPAPALRKAACNKQLAIAYDALGDRKSAASFAKASLENEPFDLYVGLIAKERV